MSDPIQWGLPPAPGRTKRDWATIVQALKGRPGEWARIETCSSQAAAGALAQQVRRSQPVPLRDGRYEAVARSVDGSYAVFARYVGGES